MAEGRGAGSAPGSSPHTRGALDWSGVCFVADRIIPAYAGSTRAGRWPCRRSEDHPRIRGEHHLGASMCTSASGSSPHTRGAPRNVPHTTPLARIIPAYAGSTPLSTPRTRSRRDHPRIRGEHPTCLSRCTSIAGSSPHTRGARETSFTDPDSAGIIPAYAGSTPVFCPLAARVADHPRIRGEHRSTETG